MTELKKLSPEQQKLFDKLTNLQKEICLNKMKGMKDIDAYRNSSGKAKDTESMQVSVCGILRNHNVVEFMESLKVEAVNDAIMSRDEMLMRLSAISRSSIGDIIEWRESADGEDSEGNEEEQSFWRVKDSAEQDPLLMAAISEVTAGRDGIKIKTHSQLSAMKQLAEMQGFNAATKYDHSSSDGSMSPTKTTLDDFYKDS